MIVKQFFILLGMLFLGYLAADGLGLPLPANVLGMGFLLLSLCLKLIKAEDVERAGTFIIEYLAVFFIPPAVGIMACFDVLSADLLKIAVPLAVSILAGFLAAGQVTQLLIQVQRRRRNAQSR